jgi:hypothetical protein
VVEVGVKHRIVVFVLCALFSFVVSNINLVAAQAVSVPNAPQAVSQPDVVSSLRFQAVQCPGFMPSRLTAGGVGRVTLGLPNRLRNQPSMGAGVLTTVPGGGTFAVISGPVCDSSAIAWWQINYNGMVGWTAEGQGNVYWLEPFNGTCAMSPRLAAGRTGRVTPGLPNTLRTLPAAGQTLGQIPAGEAFTVLGGPQCANGIWWWQVQYGSIIGWTGEGQNGTYWLEPYTGSCINAPLSRLTPGSTARITSGLPNAIRAQPGAGAILGNIPGGTTLTLNGGPQCGSDGRLWWQINYSGIVGWTAEGEGTTYWMEPATPVSACLLAPRLAPGWSGQVTPGLPNALKSGAGSGSNIGTIPANDYFRVIGGPQCVSGRWWWQVSYAGMTGWTAEGEGSTYWLQPITCAASPASRLVPNMWARVTPGLPNSLRQYPGSGSTIAQIPAGGTFYTTGAPQCGPDSRLWWPVNYNGMVGWTGEGEGSTYWLEPGN